MQGLGGLARTTNPGASRTNKWHPYILVAFCLRWLEHFPHWDDVGVDGCNISGSAPGLLLNSCFALWICETSGFCFHMWAVFFLSRRHKLRRHFVTGACSFPVSSSGFLVFKLKSLQGERLCPLDKFLLHYQRRDTIFLSPFAAAGPSSCLCRAFFWKPCAFFGRHLARELANPALPCSKWSNETLLGSGRRGKQAPCDPAALRCTIDKDKEPSTKVVHFLTSFSFIRINFVLTFSSGTLLSL